MQYDGGKGGAGVAQWLISLMPSHILYIEPFLGGGSVMRFKLPAVASIGIERDADVVLKHWQHNHGIPGLRVICGDAISELRNRSYQEKTLVYADPPYLMHTRSDKNRLYRHEMSREDHVLLLSILRRLCCFVMISGYPSALYDRALRGWHKSTFRTIKRNGKPATECVWMNYNIEEFELHDYRYLGKNFRERERIKRRIKRWCRRLQGLPRREREALLLSLNGDNRSIIGAQSDERRR